MKEILYKMNKCIKHKFTEPILPTIARVTGKIKCSSGIHSKSLASFKIYVGKHVRTYNIDFIHVITKTFTFSFEF